jgi:hypothetical protein
VLLAVQHVLQYPFADHDHLRKRSTPRDRTRQDDGSLWLCCLLLSGRNFTPPLVAGIHNPHLWLQRHEHKHTLASGTGQSATDASSPLQSSGSL